MNTRFLLALASLSFAIGCTSISSTPTSAPTDGLVYYLPKKNVVITVVKSKPDSGTKVVTTTVSIAPTAAFPDLSQSYALNFNRNLIGKNAIKVGITSTGLLTSSKSTTTPGISDVLKNLAESVAMLSGPGMAAQPAPLPQCGEGTHTFIYTVDQETKTDACDLTVIINRLDAPSATQVIEPSAAASAAVRSARDGIYYRQEQAFRVTVKGPSVNSSAVVLSPSLAPERFLPIASTLFAANEADFGFTDGMLTKYDQEADGELVAMFKLPADVIGAYFGAIGKVFDNFKSRDSKEAEVLVAATKLEMAKKKYDACLDAIKKKDDALLAQLECGK